MKLALAILLTATTGVTVIVHKRPTQARPTPASVQPVPHRASRGTPRQPLLSVKAHLRHASGQGAKPSGHSSGLPVPHVPALSSGTLSDTTMYCATGNRNAAGRWPQLGDVAVADRSIRFGTRVWIAGNVYTVEDWIGWGSDFDIYGGSDAGCEQRALDYGRRRLRVVVER